MLFVCMFNKIIRLYMYDLMCFIGVVCDFRIFVSSWEGLDFC